MTSLQGNYYKENCYKENCYKENNDKENNDKENNYNGNFSHIYVEEGIKKHYRVQKILEQFPKSQVIGVDHYKDVFCRHGQNPIYQAQAKALILAKKTGTLIYEGAKVCQRFDNEYFYYTSCVMNCLYDCEYCYLKGMYPSGHMVIFVNLEEIFAETERILQLHPAYICISYDTDLLAMETITDFVEMWINFADSCNDLRIEVRTKCGRMDLWDKFPVSKNVIFAFTISPDFIVENFEKHTSSLMARLESAKRALEKGFLVRLCFDPMIYCQNWKIYYLEMIQTVNKMIDLSCLTDVSVGTFRISQDYLKKMRRMAPSSQLIQFPYQNVDGVYQYPPRIAEEMERMMVGELTKSLPQDRIFQWK